MRDVLSPCSQAYGVKVFLLDVVPLNMLAQVLLEVLVVKPIKVLVLVGYLSSLLVLKDL